MSSFTYTAEDELDRRATNRALKKKLTHKQYLRARHAEPDTADAHALADMDNDALRALAALDTPPQGVRKAPAAKPAPARKAPAKKAPAKARRPERTATQVRHTQLRAEAFAWRNAEWHAGRSHTLATAYARFGTAPAAVTNAPGFEG